MDHNSHHNHSHAHELHDHENLTVEYIKFGFVILGIILFSVGLYFGYGQSWQDWMRYFMGSFFAVFAGFKLLDLKGFVNSYVGYDILAKRSVAYAYLYPFIELALAVLYFIGTTWVDYVTLPLMLIGAYGVALQLSKKTNIKCACLGTYIQLPLTTVSLTEDLVMAAMATIMIISGL